MSLFRELVVDNFAGGGGASTGIEMALGWPVDIAINHDPEAIAMHEMNHPQTRHFCESVWDVDPLEVTNGLPVGLVWLSPDCKHFSKAKGSKPVEKKIRGLAWIALRWAAKVKPRVIMLENVEEFKTWGPIVNGKPCPKNKGREFKSFVNALKCQGYQVEWKELRACDYGAPTIRKRLFLIARRDGQPIVWPNPTHGKPDSKEVLSGKLEPYVAAADIIDWSVPVKSIFGRKKPLVENTLKRIAKGLEKYVFNQEPFIVPTKSGAIAPFITEHANASSQRNFTLEEPLRTQCAQVKGGHFALVTPFLTKYYGPKKDEEFRGHGVEEVLHTLTTENRYGLTCAFLAKHYTGAIGDSVNNPLPTVTSVDHNALVTSHLIKLRGTNTGSPVTEPVHTVTAGGLHIGEVRAFLVQYYGTSHAANLNDPINTITTKDRFGLVTVAGQDYQIVDIGMRMLEPHELFAAQGFPHDYIIDRNPDGTKATKKSQVARCGNSVCPPLAQALVAANLPEMVAQVRAA